MFLSSNVVSVRKILENRKTLKVIPKSVPLSDMSLLYTPVNNPKIL